jgi:ComF family protein
VTISPPVCARCGAPGAWPVSRCAECAGRRLGFRSARAAIVYDERARRFVREWKERGRRDLATVAADIVSAVVPRPEAASLVAVPADRERGLRRGHSTAAGLARALARRWELPLADALRRTRPGERQRGLSLAERRRNVAGAYASTRATRAVCLVDDVYTTGATAAACAASLRRAGAEQVEVVAFARAVR